MILRGRPSFQTGTPRSPGYAGHPAIAHQVVSYGATINAIETLMPKQKADPCPTCSRDRSPGPTAGFRDFVETYAAAEGAEARDAMYRFRSALVHGHRLHSMDLPSPWGALVPGEIEHRELHDTAFAVARTAVRTWFLNPATGPVTRIGTGS
jgi:hypothetical protein